MKWKKLILISVAALLVVFASGSLYLLWDARLWPFCTGTRDEAFLGTTFGMSPQEVRRTVARHGAQLLTYEDYRRSEPSPSIDNFGFIPVFSDDRREDSAFYMSSVEMFDSKVEAEFSFRHARLVSVGVHIDPIASTKAESVVFTVESKLRRIYQFSRREESRDVPGAYTLDFTSPTAIPSLWVNLTDRGRPIIILTVVHPATQMTRTREIEDREHTAFGEKK
jgi:hypothetical protein